ncbi:MAG: PQQ-dependent sugar dehydrogenase [Bacteroidia bacterium]
MKKTALISLLSLIVTVTVYAQTPNIVLTPLGTGISSLVDVVNCGDDRLFVVEQTGRIKIYKNGAFLATPFLNLSTIVQSSGNEQGLLGLAFSPDYATDGHFYVNYTSGSGSGQSNIVRYTVSPANPDSAVFSSAFVLLTLTQPYSNHNGGNLMFGPDGYLYAGFGDGGSGGDPQGNGQNKNVKLAKMLRIDVSGPGAYTIPPTNPFVGVPNTQPEIWAYGLRNPWRYSFDRLTGDLWIGDVGQDLWEEIDRQPASSTGGENYGWKCKEGLNTYSTSGACPSTTGFVLPVYNYSHGTANGCSITGGYVYRGAKYPNLYGKYIYADYCNNKIYMLTETSPGVYTNSTLLDVAGQGFSSFGEDRYGELYVTDRDNSKLYSISDTSTCLPVADLNMPSTYSTCDSNYLLSTPYNPVMLYQWYFNGNVITGAGGNTYTATQDGDYYVDVVNTVNFCQASSDSVSLDLSVPVTATLSGLDTLYCVNWASSQLNGTPAGGTFSGPGVTGNIFNPAVAGPGLHAITYTYSQGSCFAVAQSTTTVSACTAIDHLPNTTNIRVVPNPNTGVFTLNFINAKNELITVKAENYLGQNVYEQIHAAINGDNSIVINLGDVKTGWYLLTVKKGDAIIQSQIMVK